MRVSYLPSLLRNKHPVDLGDLLIAQTIVTVKHLNLTTLSVHTPFFSETSSGPA